MLKIVFFNSDLMDDDSEEPLIGGDVHLDGIEVHDHEDSISIELKSTFLIYSTLQSSGMQPFIKTSVFTL